MKPRPLPAAMPGQTGAPALVTGNPSQRRQIRSDDLFCGQREVLIEHAGELYSLRQTSKGKLILTK
jgi:hemin uptake protein HemP